MLVCSTCFRAIESREGNIEHKDAEIDGETTKCVWCGWEFEESELVEIIEDDSRKQLGEKAKKWFGDGEIDVDLMLSMGVITIDRIIESYLMYGGVHK